MIPSNVPFAANFAEVRALAQYYQSRVLLNKLPRLVFRVVADLLLP